MEKKQPVKESLDDRIACTHSTKLRFEKVESYLKQKQAKKESKDRVKITQEYILSLLLDSYFEINKIKK